MHKRGANTVSGIQKSLFKQLKIQSRENCFK